MFLAKVKPGKEDALDDVLAEIQKDFKGNPYVRLADSPNTHFARWNVLEDEENGPRLLFSANYDGGIQDYLAELVSLGPGVDDIWGNCVGWRGPAHFVDFVRDTYCTPRGVYIGFPHETVGQIHNYIAIREELETLLDLPEVAEFLIEPGCAPLFDRLADIPRRAMLGPALRVLLTNAGESVREGLRNWYLVVAKAFAQYGQDQSFPLVRSAEPPRANEQRIDSPVSVGTVQNEMTILAEVIPARWARMQIGLTGSALLTRYGYPPGEFAGVGSLHWFAWSVIDHGRRLLFASTFDGSWQNYMQDFINKLIWGLDAIYGNTRDYPAAGMKDIVAFTEWILQHEYPAKALYSAYPQETVMNLITDRTLSREVGRSFNRPVVERWLEQL
jgi:hypothetical protein